MKRPFLLDVNVLIAMFDDAHAHFKAIHAWLPNLERRGWRTCPITENGFLRILGNPNYINGHLPVTELAGKLESTKKRVPGFAFLSDNFSMSEWANGAGRHLPAKQLTDAYLLRLALLHNCALVTYDRGITPELIGESSEDLIEWIVV